MIGTALQELVQSNLDAVKRITQRWKNLGQEEELPAVEVEEVVRVFLGFPEDLRRLVSQSWKALSSTPGVSLDQINQFRARLQRNLNTSAEFIRELQLLALERSARPLPANFPLLDGALREVEQLRAETWDHWPEFNADDLTAAEAEHARGESLDLDEAFAAMKGISVEELRRRLEEHKKSRGGAGGGR